MDKNYHDEILVMETNIDDMTGENFGFLLDTLMDNGALDVCYISAFGKKNRPLYILKVIIPIDKEKEFAKIIFKYSSSAGIRVTKTDRIIMNREILSVDVNGYSVNVKKLSFEEIEKFSPEWDNCVAVSKKLNVSPNEIYNKAISKIGKGSEK